MSCIFCDHLQPEQILLQTPAFQVVLDIDPLQAGHLLVISRQHYSDLRELPPTSLAELWDLEKNLITILESFPSVLGVSVLQNNGRTMDPGTHFHLHLVPRYAGDHFWETHTVKQHDFPLDHLKEQLKKPLQSF